MKPSGRRARPAGKRSRPPRAATAPDPRASSSSPRPTRSVGSASTEFSAGRRSRSSKTTRRWRSSRAVPLKVMGTRRLPFEARSEQPLRSRLWVLRPHAEVLERKSHPWRPWFEKVFGVVVRAANETEARALAQEEAGSEGLGVYRELGCAQEERAAAVWLDPTRTGCEELGAFGPPA